ncbi:MAG: DUF1566 domain-containing protein, partial [Desulfobacula sp.]|nr:DUF1566 domain-containing protein [Desulfobacula sp.]
MNTVRFPRLFYKGIKIPSAIFLTAGRSQQTVKSGSEVSSNYWSSTTNANNSGNAWNVNFNNGNVNNNNKSNSYYVR